MLSETPVRLEQIEVWLQALEEGRGFFVQASGLQAEAKQAQSLRQWSEAAAKFRQARLLYDTARTLLAVPAALESGSYRALRLLRDEAANLLKQVLEALAEHEHARWVELCERNIIVALEMQQQAQAALYEGNLEAARALASQAREMHPALRDEAERTIRAAGERAGEGGGRVNALVVVALVAVLLGLAIGAGPQLWQWFAG